MTDALSLKNLDFEAKVLCLDKGFAATPIVNCLTSQQQPALIANPIRGKRGGTRALCRNVPATQLLTHLLTGHR